jgi:HAD superfamily hydrolase (TIGR01509 family)
MIKAVILDYGGTLANSNVPLDATFEKAVERLLIEGIEVSALDFKNAFMDTVEWRSTIQEEGKEVDVHGFFSHVLNIFGREVSRDVTDELGLYLYETAEPEWLGDIEKLLIELSDQYKIALLSNAWLEAPRQLLRDMGYSRWFDVMVVSFDIGIPKPDQRIFQHTLNLLGVEANEAVMVGDSIKADIEGAINAGLEAIWVDTKGIGGWTGHVIWSLDELPEMLKKL